MQYVYVNQPRETKYIKGEILETAKQRFNELSIQFESMKAKYPKLMEFSLKILEDAKPLGQCHYVKKVIAIEENHLAFNDYKAAQNTLLHEIAHAIAADRGHGASFRRACEILGAHPRAVTFIKSKRPRETRPQEYRKYTSNTCKCGYTWHRDRVRQDAQMYCVACKTDLKFTKNY